MRNWCYEHCYNHLNEHFAQIGPNLALSVPTVITDPKQYLNKANSSFVIKEVTPSKVKKLLGKVDISKVTGLDNISNRILKIAAPIIYQYFTDPKQYEVRECVPRTSCSRVYFLSRRLFLGMDVIGSFMTRDVFAAVTSESTESVTFVEEWESSQREVVTDNAGQVDFSSWRLTLHGHLSDDWLSLSMRTACSWIANLLFVVVIVSVLENQETNAFNKWPVYQYPVLGQQQ